MMNDRPKADSDSNDKTTQAGATEGGEKPTVETPLPETPEHGSPSGVGIPQRVGQFRIKRAIASGGMGTVFEALQEKPRRTVAVKLMRAGIASPSALRRFEYESQLLARLRHPCIAQVYEAGTHREGDATVPYFAMEYIVGAKPITDYVKEKGLGTRERIKLFINVCDAVHHGHQKGIIHRDLKPANILVDSAGQVKIIDFGVARSTDSDMAVTMLQTEVGQLIGTLQYMSPEQCAADPHDIDTRSDVYALGVVLYQILCEQLPYDLSGAAIHEAARVIREQQPTSLSTLNRALRGDVETIALKALEKDRDRRYQSTSALTADLTRYLNNEAISARPPGVGYQIRVFARRHKGLIMAVAAVFVVLVAGVVVSTSLYFKANAARIELEQVAKFQEEQLTQINVPLMGIRLRQGLLEKVRAAAERSGAPNLDARMAQLEDMLAVADFTGLALELLDDNIFEHTVTTIDEQFENQPLVRARLLQALATTVRELGLHDRGTPPQETALGIRREILGDNHQDTLRSLKETGKLTQARGQLIEAEPFIRNALQGYRVVLGDDHPETLDVLGDLGTVLNMVGKHAEAEPYFQEALERCRRVLGNNHPSTLAAISNMGILLSSMRRFAEAEPYYRESLEGYRRVLGDDHPDTLNAINNMGYLLIAMDRPAEAEAYYSESLEGHRRVLGNDHPETLTAINNMGYLLIQLGQYTEAEGYFREALEGRRRVLGNGHHSTLMMVNNMGFLLNKLGRHAEAARMLIESEPAARLVWKGPGPHVLGNYLVKLGEAQIGLREYPEAEKTLLEAYELQQAHFEKDPTGRPRIIGQLIILYDSWHGVEPGKGYDIKATEWRSRLPSQ